MIMLYRYFILVNVKHVNLNYVYKNGILNIICTFPSNKTVPEDDMFMLKLIALIFLI